MILVCISDSHRVQSFACQTFLFNFGLSFYQCHMMGMYVWIYQNVTLPDGSLSVPILLFNQGNWRCFFELSKLLFLRMLSPGEDEITSLLMYGAGTLTSEIQYYLKLSFLFLTEYGTSTVPYQIFKIFRHHIIMKRLTTQKASN